MRKPQPTILQLTCHEYLQFLSVVDVRFLFIHSFAYIIVKKVAVRDDPAGVSTPCWRGSLQLSFHLVPPFDDTPLYTLQLTPLLVTTEANIKTKQGRSFRTLLALLSPTLIWPSPPICILNLTPLVVTKTAVKTKLRALLTRHDHVVGRSPIKKCKLR